MRHADWIIIGAGLAGSVLARALGGAAVVLDPAAGGYKIGESVIPEQFHHPLMAELLPAVRALPSWSPKLGTTFVDAGAPHCAPHEIASFPLAHHSDRSLHVMRAELESLIHRRFSTPIVQERVIDIDLAARCVTTDVGQWRSKGPIIDCSGPAMVVATALREVERLWPVWASWAYFDASPDDEAFWQRAQATPISFLDVPSGRLMKNVRRAHMPPSEATLLTRIDSGLWMWQIPLYRKKLLSVGVVSRQGPVSPEQHAEVMAAHGGACWRMTARTAELPPVTADTERFGCSLPPETRQLHSRAGFARYSRRAASADHILLGDAFSFADPVYSVGTGLAVSQALKLAGQLRSEPWTDGTAAAWDADAQAARLRGQAAFEYWYSGEVLRDGDIAQHVQEEFLVGRCFRSDLLDAYIVAIDGANRVASAAVHDEVARILAGTIAFERIEAIPSEASICIHIDSAALEVHLTDIARKSWREPSPGIGLSYRGDAPPAAAERLSALIGQAPERWRRMLDTVAAMQPSSEGKYS
ncbi:MAG: hypothetical protein KC502_15460 [Myxococcales bacterium]|nr:hypothetical protein [Myxococcales bacterium]